MPLTKEDGKTPVYGLFIRKEGKTICNTLRVKGPACQGVFAGEVIKQKAKVNEYRQKRVCGDEFCTLGTKHRKSIETTAGLYASNSPAPYKHIISATWGREDVTDLA